MGNYVERIWLNPEDHSSTGSVVVFDGEASWSSGDDHSKPCKIMYVEISDCHGKIRLHQSKYDTREQFRVKITLLRDTLSRFLDAIDNKKTAA